MQIQSQGITRSQRKTYSKKKNTRYGLHSMNSEVKGKKIKLVFIRSDI